MSHTIWKQELDIKNSQEINIPFHAEILCAKIQRDKLFLWFKFDTKDKDYPQGRVIHVFGTGHVIEEHHLKHIDTIMMANGDLVFHIFEEI